MFQLDYFNLFYHYRQIFMYKKIPLHGDSTIRKQLIAIFIMLKCGTSLCDINCITNPQWTLRSPRKCQTKVQSP